MGNNVILCIKNYLDKKILKKIFEITRCET